MANVCGAILIIAGCGGIGFYMCRNARQEIESLETLIRGLAWMRWELNYQMPPLYALCRGASEVCGGRVGRVFLYISRELEIQATPNVASCVECALKETSRLPIKTENHIRSLGTSMGRFDLQGQLSGIESIETLCKRDLEQLRNDLRLRTRNYQTLAICAGVVLVMILI